MSWVSNVDKSPWLDQVQGLWNGELEMVGNWDREQGKHVWDFLENFRFFGINFRINFGINFQGKLKKF